MDDNTGHIRIDEASSKYSIQDAIDTVCPGKGRNYTSNVLNRIMSDNVYISDRIDKLQVNGRGPVTPVASASTVVDIINLLPSDSLDVSRRDMVIRSMGQEQEKSYDSKTSLMQRSLKSANIDGSIRVDEKTGKGSLIDVIKIICPDKGEDYATHALDRILEGWTPTDRVVHTDKWQRTPHSRG